MLKIKTKIFGKNNKFFRTLSGDTGLWYRKTTRFIKQRPLSSFLIALFFLFLIIFVGNILSRPKQLASTAPFPKSVSIYSVGESPKATFQARTDNPGVVKIVALEQGIIQSINVSEGSKVYQGQQLFSLSTNYQGGNAPVIQAQIADAQYKNVQDTFKEQQDIIQKQRDIANINHDNFSDMQSIATQSANATNNLINNNQVVLNQLNQQLTNDQNSGVAQGTITAEESQINQLQGAQNQLAQSLLMLQEETDSGKPPGRLTDAQLDLTNKQLDIQEKSLELNNEVSKLQAEIADINAASMFPSSPFAAIVQRVYVRVGQNVSSGTPLAEISAIDPHPSAIVDLPENIVKAISSLEPSTIYLDGTAYSVRPVFIPTQSTNGALYSVVFPLPDSLVAKLADGNYVRIDIPVGNQDTSAAMPLIPLDAVYQTQDSNYVMLARNNTAVVQQVTLGNIFGNFVEVTSGLRSGDQIILDRNVISGDKININKL